MKFIINTMIYFIILTILVGIFRICLNQPFFPDVIGTYILRVTFAGIFAITMPMYDDD